MNYGRSKDGGYGIAGEGRKDDVKTTERQRQGLRHRAIKPSNERHRTYPLQVRLKPAEILSLLDDITDGSGLLKQSREVIDALWKEEEGTRLKGGAIVGILEDIDAFLAADSSLSARKP